LVPDLPPGEPVEAGGDAAEDQTVPQDAEAEAALDAGTDRTIDAGDAGLDATLDGPMDAPADGLDAPIDVIHPPPIACQEAGAAATLIYLITEQSDLYSFYPPSLEFHKIGPIHCPAPMGNTPFSMAVDQSGIAYVVYAAPQLDDGQPGPGNGQVFRVSTANATCEPTPLVPGQQGFQTFGMGYSQDPTGTGETLYIASDEAPDSGLPSRLGYIDTAHGFVVHTIGTFPPQVLSAELTGTGSGDLFAFYSLMPTLVGPAPPPSAIVQVDKTNGNTIGLPHMFNIGQGCAWAFAFWGGDFYTFTAGGMVGSSCSPLPNSVISRFRPSDGSFIVNYATLGETIVGAGVSTCAPQQ
jgi:hypothetical protein